MYCVRAAVDSSQRRLFHLARKRLLVGHLPSFSFKRRCVSWRCCRTAVRQLRRSSTCSDKAMSRISSFILSSSARSGRYWASEGASFGAPGLMPSMRTARSAAPSRDGRAHQDRVDCHGVRQPAIRTRSAARAQQTHKDEGLMCAKDCNKSLQANRGAKVAILRSCCHNSTACPPTSCCALSLARSSSAQ